MRLFVLITTMEKVNCVDAVLIFFAPLFPVLEKLIFVIFDSIGESE